MFQNDHEVNTIIMLHTTHSYVPTKKFRTIKTLLLRHAVKLQHKMKKGISLQSASNSLNFDVAREMMYKNGAQIKAFIGYELAQENGSINSADARDSIRDQYLDNVYEYQKIIKA